MRGPVAAPMPTLSEADGAAGSASEPIWCRYSIIITRNGEDPDVYRMADGTVAWALANANSRARTLSKRKNVAKVEVVPAAPDDGADWLKTPMANRGMLPTIEGFPRGKKERLQWIVEFARKNSLK